MIDAHASISYGELRDCAIRIACVLIDMGVRTGDRVAYLLPNGANIAACYIAIQYIGAIAVPLNPRLSTDELVLLCDTAQANVLIVDERYDSLAGQLSRILEGRTWCVELDARQDGDVDGMSELYIHFAAMKGTATERYERGYVPEVFHDPQALSRIQFTGGTSGLPKGAARTHHADVMEILACVASNDMETTENPVALIQCPLEHHGGHSWFASIISVGGTMVIVEKFDELRILDAIDVHQVTHVILLPPTTYLRLLRKDAWQRFDLSSVVIIQSSAGALPKEAIARVFEAFPRADMNYGWGQSESGTGTSVRISREMLAACVPALDSVGKPMNTLEVRIVNEQGDDLGVGEPGEALVKTPCAMVGYYNLPQATAQVFTEDGWLRTGDIMEMDEEGFLYVRSRKKDMVKSGGENVFVNEVQKALLSIPGIEDCVVFGTSDPILDEAVAAVVQLEPGVMLSREQISRACKERIASFKKPRYIDYSPNLGRDSAGKLPLSSVVAAFEARKEACRVGTSQS